MAEALVVKDMIRDGLDGFTPAERRLADTLLQDYPVAGLQSITRLARAAEVSTPTVIRMARKLGFNGFPALQERLRLEVGEQIKQPLSKRDIWQAKAADEHVLNQFAKAISANLGHTLDRLDPAMFDRVAALLADTARPVYLAGGRITRSNADYFFNHLQIIRPGVTSLNQSPNVWPQYLLDMDERSILVIFDIRRYEQDLLKLARLAHERGVTIILFTDQWGSPIGKLTEFSFNALVEAPSNWDSTISLMIIVEALIAQVQSARWEDSKGRIDELESMFSETKLFRSPDRAGR